MKKQIFVVPPAISEADRIRAMSDEELAEFLFKWKTCGLDQDDILWHLQRPSEEVRTMKKTW